MHARFSADAAALLPRGSRLCAAAALMLPLLLLLLLLLLHSTAHQCVAGLYPQPVASNALVRWRRCDTAAG
jgi:hypothetical protein